MTYQPPPPPPGTPPAGMGGRPGFDPKAINPLDWAAIGAGVLAFIFSFVSFYTADVGYSSGCPSIVRSQLNAAADQAGSASAWHGFFGWFGVLLALVGAALIAATLFAPQVSMPVPARLAALGAFAVATLFEIIAIFVTPGGSYSGSANLPGTSCSVSASVGHGFGFWITLILVIAGLVLTLMRFQATGGQLPGGMNDRIPNIGGYGPQGGISGSGGPSPTPRPGPGPQDYPPPPPPPPNA